jgi:hypothetical protein
MYSRSKASIFSDFWRLTPRDEAAPFLAVFFVLSHAAPEGVDRSCWKRFYRHNSTLYRRTKDPLKAIHPTAKAVGFLAESL